MSKSAKIPTIGGSRENYARVRKLDNLNSKKTVKLRKLLVDEVGFIDSCASLFLINSKKSDHVRRRIRPRLLDHVDSQ